MGISPKSPVQFAGSKLASIYIKLGVRCVSFFASRDTVFSVSYGENRHLEMIVQGRESALAKSLSQWSLFPSAANKARLVLSFKCQKQNAARYQTNACPE